MKALAQKKKERTVLSDELEQYRLCDPDVLKEVKQQTRVAMDATNRWTGISIYLSSICLSIYLYNYLFINLYIYPSIYLLDRSIER